MAGFVGAINISSHTPPATPMSMHIAALAIDVSNPDLTDFNVEVAQNPATPQLVKTLMIPRNGGILNARISFSPAMVRISTTLDASPTIIASLKILAHTTPFNPLAKKIVITYAIKIANNCTT